MISSHPLPRHLPAARWQRELADAFTDPAALLRRLGIDAASLCEALGEEAVAAMRNFPMRVPESYVARMRPGDPADPLLLQVLPLARETHAVPGFGGDPLGEAQARRAPGLLHKYAGRALLIATGACAVHCRYCFRREHDYGLDAGLDAALAEIAADDSIGEVILSGGDPLTLGNRRLGDLLARLAAMAQVRRVRMHTRTPVVLPSRVDEGLLSALAAVGARRGRKLVVVLHANHAAEIDATLTGAIAGLASTGATVLNQSVLLARVNDSVEALVALSEALFEAGALPYYLHQLDPVAGVAHFAVDDRRARALWQGMAARLPGYLVPRLVREIAGEPAKTWIHPGAPGEPSGASVPGLTPEPGRAS